MHSAALWGFFVLFCCFVSSLVKDKWDFQLGAVPMCSCISYLAVHGIESSPAEKLLMDPESTSSIPA